MVHVNYIILYLFEKSILVYNNLKLSILKILGSKYLSTHILFILENMCIFKKKINRTFVKIRASKYVRTHKNSVVRSAQRFSLNKCFKIETMKKIINMHVATVKYYR